jgi:predicted nucleotidyltransferase
LLAINQQKLSSATHDFELRLVVLFGSYAKGKPEPGPESDIDIAVYGCSREAYWDCFRAVSAAFGMFELDLVRLEDADPLFRHEIMQFGVLLAGDPDFFCEYHAYAYRDFMDSADLIALEDVLFQKKMARIRRILHDSP